MYSIIISESRHEIGTSDLDTNLGTAPVASLGVVLDGVASTVADPVGDWTILLLLLGQDQLLAKFLVSRHFVHQTSQVDVIMREKLCFV